MKRKALLSSVLAAAMGLTSLAPAAAVPLYSATAPAPQVSSDVTNVDHRRFRRYVPGYHERRQGGWYNGYRGSRRWRRGWRRHNGWWFPPAAFALGLIIGNSLYQGGGGYYYRERPRRYYRSEGLPPEHYRWCDWRYRTYRAWDNSYIPRVGYRAQCRSPYWP